MDAMTKSETPEVSALDLELLEVLRGGGVCGYAPSEFAYVALAAGALQCRHPRGRWRRQGAGFVGGAILSRFHRRGLVVPATMLSTLRSNKYRISSLGERLLRANQGKAGVADSPEGEG